MDPFYDLDDDMAATAITKGQAALVARITGDCALQKLPAPGCTDMLKACARFLLAASDEAGDPGAIPVPSAKELWADLEVKARQAGILL